MIKAVIFDLNGIFLQSPKLSDRFNKDFNISQDIFLPKLFEIMDNLRKPDAQKAFSYWEPVLKEWNVNFSEKEFWDYWFKAEILSIKMVSFCNELRDKEIKVVILSNNFKERAEYYESYEWIHKVVDKVYFSFKTGFVKPDKKAWELVLSDFNLKAEECLYFDDQQKNLDASESIGIKSFMFTDEESLEKIINEAIK